MRVNAVDHAEPYFPARRDGLGYSQVAHGINHERIDFSPVLHKEYVCIFLKEAGKLISVLPHLAQYELTFQPWPFECKSSGKPLSVQSETTGV